MERISVIVPIYKVEKYLDQCVRSIVDQTYTDLEIILVDDGSPDRCGELCENWAKQDSRIRVIHKENGGLSDARNAGLAVATGSLVSFIDSDDAIAPTFLEALYTAMVQSKAQVAECAVRLVNEEGKVLRTRGVSQSEVLHKIDALRRLVLEEGVYQTVWNKLYRREVIDGILFEKGKYNEDDFWTYRVFDRLDRLALIHEPLYDYLQRGGSIMGVGYNPRRLDGVEARFGRMKDLSRYEQLADLTRQQIMLDYLWHLQSILRYLQGEERNKAAATILKMKKQTPRVPGKRLTLSLQYRLWYRAFVMMPTFTARVRNILKLGL